MNYWGSKMLGFSWTFWVVFVTVFDFMMLLESPCPDIFQYVNENGILFGRIRVGHPVGSKIVLEVELSIANRVQENGEIKLTYGKEAAVTELDNGRPLYYDVSFPTWRENPPKITEILVNGDSICSGLPFNLQDVPIVTTINLKHSLTIKTVPVRLEVPIKPSTTYDPFVEGSSYNSSFYVNIGAHYYDSYSQSAVHPTIPKRTSQSVYTNDPFKQPRPQTNPYEVFQPPRNGAQEPDDFGLPPQSITDYKPTRTQSKPVVTPTPLEYNPLDMDVRIFDRNTCGKPPAGTFLIADGTPVAKGSYPWLAVLYVVVDSINLKYICGGSLVSKQHVVTAAHCVTSYKKRTDQLMVVLGKYNIRKWTADPNSVTLEAKRIDVHTDYRPLSADADVAVITLAEVIEGMKFIRPICLWNGDSNLDHVIGFSGTVAGWGKDENGDLQAEPSEVSLPIVTETKCLMSNAEFREVTSNRSFCAGSLNRAGPCQGDSGSGFMLRKDDKWFLRGIVSLSLGSREKPCNLKQYFVFTDVAPFTDWITSIINK